MKAVGATIAVVILLTSPSVRGQGNPVTNGGFEQLGPDGFAADWERVGGVTNGEVAVVDEGHRGRRALRLRRDAPEGILGLNRQWKQDSGEQGTMLSQLKGGIRFWYKLISSDDCSFEFYVIPMNADPVERTGSQRARLTLPPEHVGDGQWHQGAVKYDFTDNPKVKWVHISPRLRGGRGEMLLDDIEYVESIGPYLGLRDLEIAESEKQPGKRATITLKFKNTGDQPLSGGQARLEAPPGLRLDGAAEQPLPATAPDAEGQVQWTLVGARTKPCTVLVAAKGPQNEVTRRLELKPELQVTQLRPRTFALYTGETTDLELVLENTGHVIVTNVSAAVKLPPQVELVEGSPAAGLSALEPGRERVIKWPIKAVASSLSARIGALVHTGNAGTGTAHTRLVITVSPQDERYKFYRNPNRTTQRMQVAQLANDRVRVLFPPSTHGYGFGVLDAKVGGKWRTLAVLPHLTKFVYLDRRTGRQEHIFAPRSFTPGQVGERKQMQFQEQWTDPAGGVWLVTCAFAVTPDGDFIEAQYELSCDRARNLLLFEGPMVYAGERAFGRTKQNAIFPGLEWLEDGEVSSSALDIAPDHPHRIRYVPHPNMVTIPAMGVKAKEGVVGLLWDARQVWDGQHDRPAAVFASPDYFEGYNSHLMGLFLPSVPDWVEVNGREAATPYPLKAGKKLTLRAQIVLSAEADDSLAAMDRWFKLYGVPKPMPIPHGSWAEEIKFSAQAYMSSLWDEEERMWWTSKGGNPLMAKLARPVAYCYELFKAAQVVDDEKLDAAYRARAQEVLQLIGKEVKPSGPDLGFDFAGPVGPLTGLGARAAAQMRGQREDGSWRFDALTPRHGVFEGKDYRELGPHNAAEVGTCARTAYEVLRYARMTGDPAAYAAGRKALKFMQRFHVPRAAQVWEVPVHTPDILAAADAVDAYLEAYQIERRPEDLQAAIYWGRAGLPFLYMWNTDEFPFMRYASIPVFGATWFRGSWFGRPVQWNGLRHAYAVLKLADYDRSFPWKRVAQGITISCMYQQEQEGENVALWPDNISAIDAKKCAWIFAPAGINRVTYRLMGRDLEPQTVILGEGKERVHVNSGGDLSDAAWDGRELKFTVSYPRNESGFTLIAGLSRPEEVLLNGKPLAENEDLEQQAAHGWRYDEATGFGVVRLAADGKWDVVWRGAKPYRVSLIPKVARQIAFEFETTTEGWMAAHDLQALRVKDGVLTTRTTGGDPYMVRATVDVAGDDVPAIVIRMRVTDGNTGQFYWTTESSPTFAEDKTKRFETNTDGDWHEYRVELAGDKMWSGQRITAIRLDPTNGGTGAEVGVDWIRAAK